MLPLKTVIMFPIFSQKLCSQYVHNVFTRVQMSHFSQVFSVHMFPQVHNDVQYTLSQENERGLNLIVAHAGVMRFDHLPVPVTLVNVDCFPCSGVHEYAMTHAPHADLTVHGYGLTLYTHGVVYLKMKKTKNIFFRNEV